MLDYFSLEFVSASTRVRIALLIGSERLGHALAIPARSGSIGAFPDDTCASKHADTAGWSFCKLLSF